MHYLGAKTRLLDVIEQTLDEVAPQSPVCDLFSGSGVVAARLARHRDVVAVDIQEYARVLAAAQLRPAAVPIDRFLARAREITASIAIAELAEYEEECASSHDPGLLADVLERGSVTAGSRSDAASRLSSLLRDAADAIPARPETVHTRYYGGVYFSYRQAAALDGLASAARELPPQQRDTALAAVIGGASDAVTSVGNHFAQPVRPRTADGQIKPATIAAAGRRRALDVAELVAARLVGSASARGAAGAWHAVRADYAAALAELDGIGVVYADPPYTRDHYSRFYHVLETIALGDEPALSTSTVAGRTGPSRGLYRAERHQSPFCIKRQAEAAFALLFTRVAALGCPLVLSYSPFAEGNRPRLMTVDAITDLAAEFFASVEVRPAGDLAHSKLNASRLNVPTSCGAEVMIVCREAYRVSG